MSEVYLAESEDWNSASQEKALKQSGSLRIMNTVKPSSERTFQTPLFMETSEKLTSENLNELKSSPADSHAKIFHAPTPEEKASQENEAGCGHITQKLLGRYDPNMQSLKTFQCSLTKDSILSLETLPKMGMMRNGSVSELQISGRCIEGSDCLLLPTPQAREWKGMTGADFKMLKGEESEWGRGSLKGVLLPTLTNSYGTRYMGNNPTMKGALLPTLTINGNHNYKGASKTSGDGIITVLKRLPILPTVTRDSTNIRTKKYAQGGTPLPLALLPTIGLSEYKGSAKNRYKGSKDFHGAKMSEGLRTCKEDPIYLNPSFAEVVMGFPRGWSELSAVEMQSFRKSRNSSQGGLKK